MCTQIITLFVIMSSALLTLGQNFQINLVENSHVYRLNGLKYSASLQIIDEYIIKDKAIKLPKQCKSSANGDLFLTFIKNKKGFKNRPIPLLFAFENDTSISIYKGTKDPYNFKKATKHLLHKGIQFVEILDGNTKYIIYYPKKRANHFNTKGSLDLNKWTKISYDINEVIASKLTNTPYIIGVLDDNDDGEYSINGDVIFITDTLKKSVFGGSPYTRHLISDSKLLYFNGNYYRINYDQLSINHVLKFEEIGQHGKYSEFELLCYKLPQVKSLKIKTLNSDSIDFYDLNAKPYKLLQFYGLWCKPCVKMFPDILSFYNIYKDSIQLLSINSGDRNKNIREHNELNEIAWITGLESPNVKGYFDVTGYPTLILFDRNNQEIFRTNKISEIETYIEGLNFKR